MAKFILMLFLTAFGLLNSYSQTYNCNLLTNWESEPKVKAAKHTITINSKEISIGNFLNGGKETLKLSIDSVSVKDYNYNSSTWYYCHSFDLLSDTGERKGIVIVPTSKSKRSLNYFEFADEVTIFQYGFDY